MKEKHAAIIRIENWERLNKIFDMRADIKAPLIIERVDGAYYLLLEPRLSENVSSNCLKG